MLLDGVNVTPHPSHPNHALITFGNGNTIDFYTHPYILLANTTYAHSAYGVSKTDGNGVLYLEENDIWAL